MPLFPPAYFGSVDNGIYRSALPQAINFEFLRSLSLKTILIMENSAMDDSFASFSSESDIRIIDLNIKAREPTKADNPAVNDELVNSALKIITDSQTYPVLIVCKTGRIYSSLAVACFRKLQQWTLSATLEEFRRFAAGCRQQHQLEQFIELFDPEQVSFAALVNKKSFSYNN